MAMETALLWRDAPFAFLSRPAMERAIMTAHYRERSLRSSMVARIQHDLADKRSKKEPTHDPHADFFGGIA